MFLFSDIQVHIYHAVEVWLYCKSLSLTADLWQSPLYFVVIAVIQLVQIEQ